jgi:hypothetical protein
MSHQVYIRYKTSSIKDETRMDQPIKMVNGKPDRASIFEKYCTIGATLNNEYSGDKET